MTTDERPPAERLLAAAEELFGQRSYGRTTVADICARAGMATGSFYAYFGSKSEIFAAVVRTINRDLRRAMAMAVEQADDNQRARERACFRAFFDTLSKRPWIDRIVRESEFVAPGVFREYYEQLARGYARGVRVAQLAGEVDARYDPEVIAYVYTGIGNFVGMRWADWTAGGRVPDDVLDDVLELFARGLAPATSRSAPLARTDRRGVLRLGSPAPLSGSGCLAGWNQGPFDIKNLNFLVVSGESERCLLQGRADRDHRRAVGGGPAGGGEDRAPGRAGQVDEAHRRVRPALPHQPRHQRDRVAGGDQRHVHLQVGCLVADVGVEPGLAAGLLGVVPGGGPVRLGHDQVEVAGEGLEQRGLRFALGDREPQAPLLPEPGQRARDQRQRGRLEDRQPDGPDRLVDRRQHERLGQLEALQDRLGVLDQDLGLRCQLHAPARLDQQRQPDLVLELREL